MRGVLAEHRQFLCLRDEFDICFLKRFNGQIVPSATRASGFTLIELSIVLVIIGLVVGGVLVGQDMIKSAAVRRQVAELDKYTSATNTFQSKYGSLPGDISPTKANQFGLPANGACTVGTCLNTFDNGIIEDQSGNQAIYEVYVEPFMFFIQLSAANLLSGKFVNNGQYLVGYGHEFPPLITNPNGGVTVTTWNGHLMYYLGINGGDPVDDWMWKLSTAGVFTPWEAYSIDQKIDDGVPATGSVIAVVSTGNAAYGNPMDTTAGQCVTDATATTYNLSANTYLCRLMVRAQ